MDSSLATSGVSPKIDIIDFQSRQRQFLNELKMKHEQVNQLKKELDPASLKIHELTRSLESAKCTIEQQQQNLNLALKNTRFLEDKLQKKRDYVSRTRLQEIAVQERENLRELLQKTELQNYNLVRELNELKAQHTCDLAYQKELLNQNAKVRAKIAELIEASQKFQFDQNELINLSNKTELWEELQKSVCFYRDELYKCKDNNTMLEKKFIVANATLQKLEKLSIMEMPVDNSQEMQVIITQWEKATKWFNEQLKIQTAVIDNLTEDLKIEKETNEKLCEHGAVLETENQKLLKENMELRAKLNSFLKEQKDSEIQTNPNETIIETIKTEVIEIFDES